MFFRVEVIRVFFCEAGPLQSAQWPMVDGKYREIARFTETPVFIDPLQISQNTNVPIGRGPKPRGGGRGGDEIGPGRWRRSLGILGE